MKLSSVTIKNYRSITSAKNLPISDLTTFVGANNEGKSNILRAIALSLSILSSGRTHRINRSRTSRYYYTQEAEHLDYKWSRDYPMSAQKNAPDGRSEFLLEFDFNDSDFLDFKASVGSNLQTNLKIKLSLGRDDAKFDVILKGKGKQFLTDRLPKIAEFLAKKIRVQYIPAVRTDALARDVVNSLLDNELASLESQEDYQQLISQISALQKPILEQLSKQLSKTIKTFIPDVKSIRIESGSKIRGALRSAFSVHVNDGAETELELKGDGIKSLTAISLLRHISHDAMGSKFLVLAVEEPESHLHPQAVHKLRDVLQEISLNHQVLLTTHSPILVNRHSPSTNILVRDGNAECAKNIEVIRDSLGIQLSDNLVSARLLLLVEGTTDRDVMKSWLPACSKTLDMAMRRGDLVVQSLNGAQKLGYRLGIYQSLLCNTHVFLDNDPAGREAVKAAKNKLLLNDKDYNLTAVSGMKLSELEDMIDPNVYLATVNDKFGISIESTEFKNPGLKWSSKMESILTKHTKIWDEETEREIKLLVAEEAVKFGKAAVLPSAETGLNTLVQALEKRLSVS